MKPRLFMSFAVLFLAAVVFTATLSAQAAEVYLNAGGFWPRATHTYGDFQNEGIYGVKGGAFLTPRWELEGSFGYINHFQETNSHFTLSPAGAVSAPSTIGFLYDVNGAYNLGSRNLFNTRVSPYVTLGVGGLTAEVRNAKSTFLLGGYTTDPASGAIVSLPGQSVLLNDGDTFFTLNYGGGIKALRLWGPMGLRGDFRGRTIPNLFGKTLSWPELTGGLTFSWGER